MLQLFRQLVVLHFSLDHVHPIAELRLLLVPAHEQRENVAEQEGGEDRPQQENGNAHVVELDAGLDRRVGEPCDAGVRRAFANPKEHEHDGVDGLDVRWR
jgi:hypothetical protein